MNKLLGGVLLIMSGLAQAQMITDTALANNQDEPRFKQLSQMLRCMVCQNQSIADSNADLARDFRNRVKEQINAGQTNEQIIQYMVERYGDYIVYKPPFNWTTAILWLGPFILAVLGFIMIGRMIKGRSLPPAIDGDQQQRLRLLMDEQVAATHQEERP